MLTDVVGKLLMVMDVVHLGGCQDKCLRSVEVAGTVNAAARDMA